MELSSSEDEQDAATTTAVEAISSSSSIASTSEVDVPLGYQLVEVSSVNVSFAAPADWEDIEPDAVFGTDNAAAVEVADRLGVTLDQLESTVDLAMDVMVIEPFGLMFSDNINLISVAMAEVPPASFIERDLEAFGATIVGSAEVAGPGASGVQVDYELPIGGAVVQGSSIALLINGQLRNFTVSTDDRADTAELADIVVATAHSS